MTIHFAYLVDALIMGAAWWLSLLGGSIASGLMGLNPRIKTLCLVALTLPVLYVPCRMGYLIPINVAW